MSGTKFVCVSIIDHFKRGHLEIVVYGEYLRKIFLFYSREFEGNFVFSSLSSTQTRRIYANRLHFPRSSDCLIVSVVPCVTWFELRLRL